MEKLSGAASSGVPIESGYIGATIQNTANNQLSIHSSHLSLSQLTYHSFKELNEIQNQGSENSKSLAKLAKDAIQSNLLLLAPDQPSTNFAEYSRKLNGHSLTIKVYMNELRQYKILSIDVKRDSGEKLSIKLSRSDDTPETTQADNDKSSLLNIPIECTRLIMREIIASENKRQAAYDLSALGVGNRHLKSILMNDALLKAEHDTHKKIIGAINHLPIEDFVELAGSHLFSMASQFKKDACYLYAIKSGDENNISSIGAAIGDLTQPQRSHFIKHFLDIARSEDADTSGAIGGIIGNLGKGLHTISEHHPEIVGTVLRMEDRGKAFAINGLGEGLDALDGGLRDKLLQAALALHNESDRATAITGLCHKFSSLTNEQRSQVFDAALRISNEFDFRVHVVSAFSEQLDILESNQQLHLATAVMAMAEPDEKAYSLSSMGYGLRKVSGSSYVKLLECLSHSAFSISSEENRAVALEGLGRGLHVEANLDDLTSENYIQLIHQLIVNVLAIKGDKNKSRAITGLGNSGMQAFTAQQRTDVLTMSLGIESEKNQAYAIAGLGASLSALDLKQREKLLRICLTMENPANKAVAIQGLAAGLIELTPEQRAKLTDAAIALPSEKDKWKTIGALKNIKEPYHFLRLVNAALNTQTRSSESNILQYLEVLSQLTFRNLKSEI